MIIKGNKYLVNLEEHVKTASYFSREEHYDDPTKKKEKWYEGDGILESLEDEKKYIFHFKTTNIDDINEENLKKKIMNVEGFEISPENESKLIDFLLEGVCKKVKGYQNGFRATIYFEGKPLERRYLEDKGIIDEENGQKRIIFD